MSKEVIAVGSWEASMELINLRFSRLGRNARKGLVLANGRHPVDVLAEVAKSPGRLDSGENPQSLSRKLTKRLQPY